MRVGLSAVVVAVVVALPAVAGSWVTSGRAAAAKPQTFRIVFTGKGGGRYLDVSKWLEADDHACYARQTADETLSVSWSIEWTATLERRGGRSYLVPRKRVRATVEGGVQGTAVRDYCDEPEEGPEEIGPDWPGTTQCDGEMGLRSRGSFQLADGPRRTLILRGPIFGSPPKPCELDVRNDQLRAAVAVSARAIQQLSAGGRAISVPVGTRHPGGGVTYEATRNCTPFPHLYDGAIYLYECSDTLTWAGRVSLSRTAP